MADFQKNDPITAQEINTLPEVDAKYLYNVPTTLPGFLFTALPATPKQGDRALLLDGPASPTYLATVTVGGGTNKVPIYFDGTNWRFA